MKILDTNKSKAAYHNKRSFNTANSNKFTTSKKADASSMMALDSNGRVLVNLSKISFKGNLSNTSLEEYLEDLGFNTYTIKEILKLPVAQKNEAIKLYQEGIIPESLVVEFVQKDEKIKSKLLELIQKGIWSYIAIGNIEQEWDGSHFVNLDTEAIFKKCDKINDMLNKGIEADSISMMIASEVELSDEIAKRTSWFLKKIKQSPELMIENIFGMHNIAEIAQNEETYKRAVILFDMGITDLNIIEKLAKSKDSFKNGIEYLNFGYEENDIRTLSGISDESCLEKVKELMAKYPISASLAKEIAESDKFEKYENALQKLLKEKITPHEDLIKLDDELLDKVIQLIKDGYGEGEILSIFSSFYSKNMKLNRLIEENEQNSKKWNNFVKSSPNRSYYHKELTKQDIYFLKRHIFDNQFYNPDEYIKMFLYLKNLKTINGENILGCESFGNKIKTHGLGDFAAKEEDMLYRNIEAILSINPESQKTKYIQRILELIQNGKINPSAFRKLLDLNDLKSFESMLFGFDFETKTKSNNWDISNNLINDIELIGDAEFSIKNYLDKYIPQYKSEKEGIENSKIGDSFILDNENYIRIKTDEDKSEIVKLKKETYAKLFPPIERFLSSQQIMGNCYCIETLMSMYCNNNTRINLLRCIEEDDDGNIIIKIGDYKPVIFKEGKFPENESKEIYSSGADGYKLFEYAYSCARVEDKVKEAREHLLGDKLAEFNDFINLNPNNFFIYKDNDEIKWTTYEEAIEKGYYKKMALNPFGIQPYKTFNNLLLGNGGMQNDVYRKLGYKSEVYMNTDGMLINNQLSKKELIKMFREQGIDIDDVNTLNKAKKILKSPNFLKNHQIQISLGAHAYNLTQETDNNGNTAYYLYNPHNQGFPIKFSNLDDLLSKVTQVVIVQINQLN